MRRYVCMRVGIARTATIQKRLVQPFGNDMLNVRRNECLRAVAVTKKGTKIK